MIGGFAVDRSGDLIIAEPIFSRVRKIRVDDGAVTPVAGKRGRLIGGDRGLAVKAGVSAWSVSIDAEGNIFIVEADRIRRVDARTGLIRTIAGSGKRNSSGDGGPALKAGFLHANGLAIDPAGNLFVSQGDGGDSYRIRRIDSATGVIQTIAGPGKPDVRGDQGPAVLARVRPDGLALKRNGDLLIVDGFDDRVRLIDARAQVISTVAGTTKGFAGDGGPASQARLNEPCGIALDSDENLYIAEFGNNRVRRVDAKTGLIETVAGNGRPKRIVGHK
jgi:hypothetical protein